MRRARYQHWYENIQLRGRFERGVHDAYPNVLITPGWRGRDVIYTLKAEIPEFEDREIEVLVKGKQSEPFTVHVRSDSTSKLKHTFGPMQGSNDDRERLCIWYYGDPESERWVWKDGLVQLFNLARIHLYKEAYYAKYGVWLGPEAPHDAKSEDAE